MLNLPPRLSTRLNSSQFANLHTFLVAARHLSFALAAEELCLTPSAVSHRIARLEQALSLRLFERLTRRIRLTSEGERVFAILQGAMGQLCDALEQSPQAALSGPVALYARPSAAQCWLVPRLADFHQRYPNIALDVRVGNDAVDFRTQNIDLALLYANGEFAGLVSHALMSETIAPVCSPHYAALHGLHGAPHNPATARRRRAQSMAVPFWGTWYLLGMSLPTALGGCWAPACCAGGQRPLRASAQKLYLAVRVKLRGSPNTSYGLQVELLAMPW